jgi:hypothetical protein
MLATHISVERKFVSRGIEEILRNYGHLICFAAVLPLSSLTVLIASMYRAANVRCLSIPLHMIRSGSPKRRRRRHGLF